MKKVVLVLAFIFSFYAFSQRKPKNLPPFNGVELKDDLKIKLIKAREEGIFLTADDNLIDVLKFEVVDGVLEISSFYKITAKKKLEIIVNYQELSSVVVHDGRIETTDNIVAEVFNAKLSNSGKLEMAVNANIINLEMIGNSSGDLSFEADTLNIDLRDRVDSKIYAVTEWTKVKLASSANVKMEGTAFALSAELSDNSNLRAAKLEAEGVEVIAVGSPNARVFASKDFELTSSGSSKTYLSGNPKIDIVAFLDTSQLHKEK